MPLPFLTADREAEVLAAQAVPPPHADREEWRRPYRPGPWRVGGGALLLLLASYVLFSSLIIALAGAPVSAVVCAVLGALLVAAAVRLLQAGTWVSAHGVRQVRLWRTSTLRWREVESIRTLQQPVKWLGLPRTVQGQAVVLDRTGRTSSSTRAVLLTDHSADFLGRPGSFERAADVLEAWAAESGRAHG
ncbi:hypothetical protein [Streptomyces cacaoi]|uniref:Membrane protein n=1 Tax=Streptomyces cacaoi TaxID=1898 RepID=A0A4Y3RCE3_STRCI|nr:hypothetical protein [Streptomyces cacaoi]NNG86671.1 hypothetical protein [Streptomyces cacaoi]GEB54333.1 membrane protein [Streptomyces cacaoi]